MVELSLFKEKHGRNPAVSLAEPIVKSEFKIESIFSKGRVETKETSTQTDASTDGVANEIRLKPESALTLSGGGRFDVREDDSDSDHEERMAAEMAIAAEEDDDEDDDNDSGSGELKIDESVDGGGCGIDDDVDADASVGGGDGMNLGDEKRAPVGKEWGPNSFSSTFTCHFCDEAFRKDYKLKLHLMLNHKHEPAEEMAKAKEVLTKSKLDGCVHKCALCGSKYNSVANFTRHIKDVHQISRAEYREQYGSSEVQFVIFTFTFSTPK